MKFTQIPATTFQSLQLNAGILVDEFTVNTETIGNLLGATTGGINFTDTVSFTDLAADIDNAPKNAKEYKKIESRDVKLSGTFVSITAALAAQLGIGDNTSGNVVPRSTLKATDFDDVWWVGDYSDINSGATAGYVAIHLINALNTGGFKLTTQDNGKGTFPFEFTGHYSASSPDTVPYEIYIKAGTASA